MTKDSFIGYALLALVALIVIVVGVWSGGFPGAPYMPD